MAFQVSYIESKRNKIARFFERALKDYIFADATKEFVKPTIDELASRRNYKLKGFFLF